MGAVVWLEAALLAATVSLDVFAAGAAYGGSGTRVPFVSGAIVVCVGAGAMVLAMLAGGLVSAWLPTGAARAASFGTLFFIGVCRLADGSAKALIRKYAGRRGRVQFSLFSLRCVLHVYADPDLADADANKTLSPTEAAVLAASTSLDCLGAGLGAGLGAASPLAAAVCTLAIGACALRGGIAFGRRVQQKLPVDVSALGGAALIALAVGRLV